MFEHFRPILQGELVRHTLVDLDLAGFDFRDKKVELFRDIARNLEFILLRYLASNPIGVLYQRCSLLTSGFKYARIARALKIGKIADGGMPPTYETMHWDADWLERKQSGPWQWYFFKSSW
jgi:hypothetical protein